MKKTIISLALVTTFALAGYFAYQYYSFGNQNIWKLIPEDAFAIIEIDDISKEWTTIENSPLAKMTTSLPFSKGTTAELERISDVLKKEGFNINDLLAGKRLTFSMHQKDDGSYATLIYLPVERADISCLKEINKDYKSNSNACKTSSYNGRWYMGYSQGDYTVYAYDYNASVIFSSSEELIKKAIARTNKIDTEVDILENKRYHETNEANTSKISLYLKTGVFLKGLKPYFTEESHALIEALGRFEDNAFLDVSIDEAGLSLNGFSHSSDNKKSYLSNFENQEANRFFLENYIPLRATLVNFWHITDGSQFEYKLSKYWESNNSKYTKERKDLVSNFDIQLTQLNQQIQGQVAYLQLKNQVADLDEIALIHVNDAEEVKTILEDIAYKMSSSEVTKETYEGNEIIELELYDFPALMLGEYYTGFDKTYFCLKDDYLIMSNENHVVKAYLDDLKKGSVWKRSLSKTVYVEENMIESNFGLYLDIPQTKNFFKENLSPLGKSYYEEYESQINQVEKVLLQISTGENGQFYTALSLETGNNNTENDDEEIIAEIITSHEYKELLNIELDTTIITKPILVKNYKTKTLDVLVQTADFKLYNISRKGDIIWSLQLDTTLIQKAFEVDYYTNGKLQYLLTTHKQVYLIDRLGNIVEGYPFALPNKEAIETISLFDYDANRKYRILLSDAQGQLYLFDKTGKNLAGWNPLKLNAPLVEAPKHIRVRGRDFIIAIEKSGIINIVNRRGEKVSGFPIALKESVTGNIHVEVNNSMGTSIIKVLTNSGKVMSVNLMGKYSEDEFWMKGEAPSLLSESGGSNYLLRNELTGKELFFTSDRLELHSQDIDNSIAQYYTFNDRDVLVISGEKTSDFKMIVDKVNIAPEGLSSEQEVGILYSKRKNIFQIYMVSGKTMQLIQTRFE